MSNIVYIAYEDDLSLAVIQRCISQIDRKLVIGHKFWNYGSGYLRKNIVAFNELSKGMPLLLQTDLDTYECPPSLIQNWINVSINPHFIFCVAVREIEAWVLADRVAFSKWLNISISHLSLEPESIADPKQYLINLVKRSRKNSLKRDIVPEKSSTAQIGKNYNGQLLNFVSQHWDMHRAATHSKSLKRMIQKLEQI